MGKIEMLDCTLRDGGYVNDWNFGKKTIVGFLNKIEKTNIEYCEIGFLKDKNYKEDVALFPDFDCIKNVISKKSKNIKYFCMYDTSSPIDLNKFSNCKDVVIDGVRVIFKKSKIKEGIEAVKKFIELGFLVSANFVNTEVFDKDILIDTIKQFNKIKPFAIALVDTFGDLNKLEFLNLVSIINENLDDDIALCYHAHNNMQQAFQNAQSLIELNLKRDIIIDGCVFGMGRGAGNLNLELFSDYLNNNYNKTYNIIPMLEIMDEYLQDVYKNKFWGYSIPLYISASLKVHPNYAIYLASKNTLTERSLYEIMKLITDEDKINYNEDRAFIYYSKYQENYINDDKDKMLLAKEFENKKILLLAPGHSLNIYRDKLLDIIKDKNIVVISLNFYHDEFKPQYVFSSNMRRYSKIDGDNRFKSIITSNMREAIKKDYVINYAGILNKDKIIYDNSGLMMIKLLIELGVKNVMIAGMDGYNINNESVYFDEKIFYDFSKEAKERNYLIKNEINNLKSRINIEFITDSLYA